MADIPLAPLARILKKAGADRVSNDAVKALRDVVEDYALEVAANSVTLGRHAGRKTVKSEDIKLAR